MCQELKLIIEVDGWTHTFGEIVEKDIKRQEDLEEAGFTVIRFCDDEVLQDINGVIRAIEDKVQVLKNEKLALTYAINHQQELSKELHLTN